MFSWIWADAANVYDVMQSWHQEFKGLVDVHVFCLCFLAYCAFVSKVTHLAFTFVMPNALLNIYLMPPRAPLFGGTVAFVAKCSCKKNIFGSNHENEIPGRAIASQ